MTDDLNRTQDSAQPGDLSGADEHSSRFSRLEREPGTRRPDDGDSVVREYEARYRPAAYPGDVSKPKRGAQAFDGFFEKAKRREVPLSYSTMNLGEDEKLWAALAHASIWLSLLFGVFSGGTLLPITVFVPLVIYFAFRGKSDYVAFHALQAFVLQLLATVGVAVVAAVFGVLWVVGLILAALSVLILVGIVLLPLWLIAGVACFAGLAVAPVVAGVLGAIAAVEVYRGRDYQLPVIARWIDRQLAGSYIRAV